MSLRVSDIGRIVHYRMDGFCVPAMITKIYPNSNDVDLAIFQPGLQATEFFVDVVLDYIEYNWVTEDGMTGIYVPDHAALTGYWHNLEPVG